MAFVCFEWPITQTIQVLTSTTPLQGRGSQRWNPGISQEEQTDWRSTVDRSWTTALQLDDQIHWLMDTIIKQKIDEGINVSVCTCAQLKVPHLEKPIIHWTTEEIIVNFRCQQSMPEVSVASTAQRLTQKFMKHLMFLWNVTSYRGNPTQWSYSGHLPAAQKEVD